MRGEISDFQRVTSRMDQKECKPKIKFKIVPPPPKSKPEPPPPPPPPKKPASPKIRRQKRTVEVDVFRLCWRESWMSLKPPKYLFLKANESKPKTQGFTTIEVTENRKYKADRCGSDAEWMPAERWSQSWEQVPRNQWSCVQICQKSSVFIEHSRDQNTKPSFVFPVYR